ncbi:RNA 3'-terminal phosphate cyclase [uncultured archaeon]|nr:RNA 3'-terminal phosphate cyclase [uncultured archaeon]
MIGIDGSHGEGGGAVLRNAVALSAAFGKPVKVSKIREGRKEPGLKNQHLTGVRALAQICGAKTGGLELGSTEIFFEPGEVEAGNYFFDVGTAGSVTLVLQTLLPALAAARGESTVRVVGGTDVPFSPPADYAARVLCPVLGLMGLRASIAVERRGWYPKGGGAVLATVTPSGKGLKPLSLVERGELVSVKGISVASGLPGHVPERQAKAAEEELLKAGIKCGVSASVEPSLSIGSSITLWAELSSGAVLGASAMGERGKPAEEVGRAAARELSKSIESGACVDKHLCDQLLSLAALAEGESRFLAEGLTRHAETNAWLLERFLKKEVRIEKLASGVARIEVEGEGRL